VFATRPWEHADESRSAPSLVLPLPVRGRGELILLVEEGDNEPLSIEQPTLLLPAYAVRLFRPAGAALRLAYGRADLAMPRYDIQLLAPQVLGRPAIEVAAGPEQDRGAAPRPGAIVSGLVFWTVMVVSVLVLLGIIVRLVRTVEKEA
jgi:hypothetical protein